MKSATLRELTEELSALMDPLSAGTQTYARDIETFEQLRKLVMHAARHLDAEKFSAEELRTMNTFVIGVQCARTMAPDTARGYLAAIWRGGAQTLVGKLAFGHQIERMMKAFTDGGSNEQAR